MAKKHRRSKRARESARWEASTVQAPPLALNDTKATSEAPAFQCPRCPATVDDLAALDDHNELVHLGSN